VADGHVGTVGLDAAGRHQELLHLAGANGAGKTSLLRILCGLLLPAHGEVRWGGQPIAAMREGPPGIHGALADLESHGWARRLPDRHWALTAIGLRHAEEFFAQTEGRP